MRNKQKARRQSGVITTIPPFTKEVLKEKTPYSRLYAIAGIIVLLTFLVYIPSIHNDLLKTWDDQAYVTNNDLVKDISLQSVAKIFKEDRGLYANYHPLTTLSLAINYSFSGLNPSGYRIVNILLHLLNTFLVFLFIYTLAGKRLEIAVVTSLLFGLHPMHVESVAWISERKDVLYAAFFLLALISYQKYIKKNDLKFYILSLFLFLCSLLSKAMAASLPLVLFLIDYMMKRKWDFRLWLEKIPYFVLSVILGLYAIYIQAEGHATSSIMFSWASRFLHACYGFIGYIYKILIPVNLSAFYPYPYPLVNSAWVMNTTPLSIYLNVFLCICLAILLVVVIIKPSKYKPVLIFGILFYFFTIALVLQFLPVGRAIMADRYSYIPSIGLFFIFAFLLYELYKVRKYRVVAISLTCVYAAVLFYLTFQRCQVWKNDETLWSDVIRKYPGDNRVALAIYNRAIYYEQEDKIHEALNDFLTLASYSPRDENVLEKIGKIYGQKLNDLDKAIIYFQKAYEINPSSIDILKDLGTVYGIKGDPQKSLEYSLKGLEIKGDDAFLLMNAGVGYQNLGNPQKASEYIEKAQRLDPSLKPK